MSRRVKQVDRTWLEICVKEAEKDGSVPGGIVAMHKKVCELYNAGDVPEQISYSVIGLRINEWKIPFITEPGKRGRAGGNPNLGEIRRNTKGGRRRKFATDPKLVEHFDQLRQKVPRRFLPVVDAVQKGSKAAAVKLHCLECCAYMTAEVRRCSDNGSCHLWPFRPYQESDEETQDEESQSEAA